MRMVSLLFRSLYEHLRRLSDVPLSSEHNRKIAVNGSVVNTGRYLCVTLFFCSRP